MSKVKLLSTLSIILLAINVFLLYQLFAQKPHPGKVRGPRNQIIKQLQFDDNQVAKYDALIKEHRKGIDANNEQIKALKKELYINLRGSKNTNNSDSLINELAKLTTQIEQINMQHFKDIRTICTKEQMPLYNEFCGQIGDLFAKSNKEHRGR